MKTKVKPAVDRIMIKRLEAESITPGGILIPEKAKERPQMGEVVFIHDGSDFQVGAKVLFTAYVGDEVKLDGLLYVIMKEEDILAVIEGPCGS